MGAPPPMKGSSRLGARLSHYSPIIASSVAAAQTNIILMRLSRQIQLTRERCEDMRRYCSYR